MMTVFTLTNYCDCGSTTILGVFSTMEAVIERLRMLAACTDVGDEYSIECFELKQFEEEVENTERILRSCIDDGIKDALSCRKQEYDDTRLMEHIAEYIWLAIDYYFDFEGTNG